MHPSHFASISPDKPAIIMADGGTVITYRELDERSNRAARLFRSLGLRAGDVVALWIENHERYLDIAWAAQRAGLYLVCVSSKLTVGEAAYIVADSGAKLLIGSFALRTMAEQLPALFPDLPLFLIGGTLPGYRDWISESDAFDATPIDDERAGSDMLYSSGTTGRPKGVKLALPQDPSFTGPTTLTRIAQGPFGFAADMVYLCPAPLYHAAPLRWTMEAQRAGGTIVLMEKFDPEHALALIARHRVTHSQWVPTHFVRMLKLPDAVRARYDMSSLTLALHAAAPCPVPVKQAMIDWWGPILVEYYAGTEGNGLTMVTSPEWLARPGTVGRAVLGETRVCDEDGEPVAAGTEGLVYFANGPAFEYHNDPAKTAEARNRHGWTTLGDVGRLDPDGYLYLTDRKSFMIISGGVNIYPQEIENLLLLHPKVLDAAVIGAPDAEMGERVVAVVQPARWSDAGDALAQELGDWLRPQLSGVKMPRQIDFMADLPRHATGKLYKRLLRDRYWAQAPVVA